MQFPISAPQRNGEPLVEAGCVDVDFTHGLSLLCYLLYLCSSCLF